MTAPSVDIWNVGMLMRFDAAMFVLMVCVGIYVLRETIAQWLEHRGKDRRELMRTLRLMLAFASLSLWIAAFELTLVSVRAAMGDGLDTTGFTSARWRLIVPAAGVGLAIGIVHWLADGRRWMVTISLAVTALLLVWPEPIRVLGLALFHWATMS